METLKTLNTTIPDFLSLQNISMVVGVAEDVKDVKHVDG
jgi:hypothetical protein